jgi:hypothetical protein
VQANWVTLGSVHYSLQHLWSYVTSVFFPILLFKQFGEFFQSSSQISWIYTWKKIRKFPKTFVARLCENYPKIIYRCICPVHGIWVFRKHMILCDKWMQFGSSNNTWSSLSAIWVLDGIEHVHSAIDCYDIDKLISNALWCSSIFNIGSSNHP